MKSYTMANSIFHLLPSLACKGFTDIYVAITNVTFLITVILMKYYWTMTKTFVFALSPPSPPFAVIFLLTYLFAPSQRCERLEQARVRDHLLSWYKKINFWALNLFYGQLCKALVWNKARVWNISLSGQERMPWR